MIKLPVEFESRMKIMLGTDYDSFINCYSLPPVRGLRVNTLKISKDDFLKLCPWETKQADTLDEGLILLREAEHIGTHPYHIAGLFYMQEPSAMSVIDRADIRPGMRVLDMCAAPGGKSGGAAARMCGSGVLVSNEIVPSRAKLLAQNLERLGVMNSVVTCAHPDAIAAALPHYFDRVLVDAPCSGEGMFRKDETAIAEWSPEHVRTCALRQRAILESAAECVIVGGKLIYSTCTFSYEENEGVIESFLNEHQEFELECMDRLYPHTSYGEGHFVARLVRIDDESGSNHARRSAAEAPRKHGGSGSPVPFACSIDKKSFSIVHSFLEDTFMRTPNEHELLPRTHLTDDGRVLYVPFEIGSAVKKLRIISFGTEIGSICKGRLKPSHSIFMCSKGFTARNGVYLSSDCAEMRTFLSGNVISVDKSLKGYLPVYADGFTVGFGKAVDGTLKNHLPKGLMVASLR